MRYNLTCTVTKTVGGLVNSIIATWTTPGGNTVSNGNGITVSMATTSRDTASVLTFDPLRTSHGSNYYCDGRLISPALETPLTTFTVEELQVQSKTIILCSVLMSTHMLIVITCGTVANYEHFVCLLCMGGISLPQPIPTSNHEFPLPLPN